MTRLLLIETSTELCSAALSEDERVICYRESSAPKAHAAMTAVYVKEILDSTGLSAAGCDGVCVSMGPGSYTGLRVGVSTAKGLCFGSGIPLLAVGTLDVLVWQAIIGQALPEGCRYIIPMIDARRMEAYTAVFDTEGKQIRETRPEILSEDSFREYLNDGSVLFIGDAAGKASDVIVHPEAHFLHCCPKASSMAIPALAEYKEKRFKDVAYFEPFYLKEFVATVSRKKLF